MAPEPKVGQGGLLTQFPSLQDVAQLTPELAVKGLGSSASGLSSARARERLATYGPNTIAAERQTSWFTMLLSNLRDPLSGLLLVLAVISYFTGDQRSTVLIVVMLVLSVGLRFLQELKADHAAEKLKAMVRTTATVVRGGAALEVPLRALVPGDVVQLSAGDMVPADLRLIESRDLFVNQATLTGEALPVGKHAPAVTDKSLAQFDIPNLCFMGTDVESGTATALVVATAGATYFGGLSLSLQRRDEVTDFDRGVTRFTWLMIRFIAVMVPLVFLINWFGKGDWAQAFLFALAVAVGLTPELLPMIVTVNLSKGALNMSKQKVIVKRLNAIQNFGAMDILCTDKTGTLTEGKVTLIKHVDIEGKENSDVLTYAYLNSFYQTGLRNLLDQAVLAHDTAQAQRVEHSYQKVDEVPFDFVRRRMSVVVEDGKGKHLLICKGAVEEVLAQSNAVQVAGRTLPLSQLHHQSKQDLVGKLNAQGFRLIALAIRELPPSKRVYSVADEVNLTLVGFLAFLDPAKPTAAQALKDLSRHGVQVKVLTGDNEVVTRKLCSEVGLPITRILLGSEVDKFSDAELEQAAEEATVFDKLEPAHKERVIQALKRRGHVVGFMGDGINDAPALKAADVGISVDSAVDIAKESSDIILLEKSLYVLKDGVREGRKVFGNIDKYIKMTASSNFGNMLSVVGASLFLPFLPMLPIQVIANNLLYDLSQVAIPTDGVDVEYLNRPRPWNLKHLERFILIMGSVSSVFDFATYAILIFLFGAWTGAQALFHTGWFVESLLSQTLIIHILRTNRLPFFQSRASWPLTITTLAAVAVGVYLPFSPLAQTLSFVPLPGRYWLFMLGVLLLYAAAAQLVKRWFERYVEAKSQPV